MSKYSTSLTATKQENEAALAPAKADEQAAALGLTISKKSLELKSFDNRLASLKSGYPLDFESIVQVGNEQEWLKREVAQLEALKADLFA